MTTSTPARRLGRTIPRLPGRGIPLEHAMAFRRDQIGFLERTLRDHGDIVEVPFLGTSITLLNHPDQVNHVLVDNNLNYDKHSVLYRAVAPVLRGGLIGHPGGDEWKIQRRRVQPSFHQPKVKRYTERMAEEIDTTLDGWDERVSRDDVVDMSGEMGNLALRIVVRTMFGADTGVSTAGIEQDFLEANDFLGRFVRFPFPPLTWPTPSRRRLWKLIARWDEFVDGLVSQRTDHTGHNDLLSALAQAVDSETGTGMTPFQLRVEVLNVIIGGYETSSNSAAWLLQVLADHPEVQEEVAAEIDREIGGRRPEFTDLPRLSYTRAVVDETLRLYTPAWQTMRRAVADDEIDGYHIPAGTAFYINFFTMHRHPDFWPDPLRFDPGRFTAQENARRPKNVYIPFGAGPRICLGKHFALTELMMILTMIVQRYRVEMPADRTRPELEPLVTLHAQGGVHLRARRR